jgi:hypothetical protein
MADTATVNQDLLESFRVSGDDLRDLDALLQREPGAEIEYRVFRRDTVSYQTHDVADVVGERNGSQTGITKMVVSLRRDDPALSLVLTFGEGVTLTGKSDDRGILVLLIQDIKNFIRERCPGRGSSRRRVYATLYAPVALSLLLTFAYLQVQTISDSHSNTQFQHASDRVTRLNSQALERQQRASAAQARVMARKGERALRSGRPSSI